MRWTAGFSAPSGDIPQAWLCCTFKIRRDGGFQMFSRRMLVGVFLAVHGSEHHVFRPSAEGG